MKLRDYTHSDAMACVTCCFYDNKVHPLENVLDLAEVSHDETFVSLETQYSSQDGNINVYGLSPTQTHTFRLTSSTTKLDSIDSAGTNASVHRDQAQITAVHAASLNGDKSSLAKLLISNARDLDTGDKFGRTPLMYCVLGDRMECAEMLIKANADVNKRDIGGRTALHWAAHKGNFRCLKLLLNKGANWNEKDHEGQTAMHLSTRHKSPKCLALLMKQLEMAEIDDQDNNKRTCLHWAASYGNLEDIKLLTKADSNIGIPDIDGKTPLHWAASSQDSQAVDCVQLILETTPNVINWQDYEGRAALHLAVADGNEAVVNALTSLEKCNVSALDNMFRTPLHWAAVLGHSCIVKMLLDRNADFASSDSNGATPLHYAAQNNFAETVEVFLSHETMQDWPDIEGRSAFMWAAGKGADDVIDAFIKHNVDMHQTDKNGGTALHAVALAGHATSVKLLLDHKAPINATDLLKHTPLFRACEMGHMDVVQTLIDCGAHVDVYDQDGRSPLHWAALGGHAYICQTLIRFGIDPNIRDISERTPLQCAAYGGFVNCMSVLIERKSEPNCQDNEGMTALHWACSKGHLDAVKLLIEKHAFPNHMVLSEDRYTPLDYALMGEHIEVAHYMVEQGGLSITGIQDIAALKIQACFRGYRVRKTFLERKKLLMKHEQLRKDAAKKKAEEEYKKNEDLRNKKEIEEKLKQEQEDVPSPKDGASLPVVCVQEIMTSSKHEYTSLRDEHLHTADHQRKLDAAMAIQRAWRRWRYRQKTILNIAEQNTTAPQLQGGEQEWIRQVAAYTIQLCWRKYYRRKLLKCLTPKNRRILHMWDPDVIASKQKALIDNVHGEQTIVAEQHPPMRHAAKPEWFKCMSSPGPESPNFATHSSHNTRHNKDRHTWSNYEFLESSDELPPMSDSLQPQDRSHND